jgi:hypothetical protein
MSTPSEIAAMDRAAAATIPVDMNKYRWFTLAPVYIETGIDRPPYNTDLIASLGLQNALAAVKFKMPVGTSGTTAIRWVFGLREQPFLVLAEELSRTGMVNRETKTYYRIDRSDISISVGLPESLALTYNPLQLFVFTASSNHRRMLAFNHGTSFSIISSEPDAGLQTEMNGII